MYLIIINSILIMANFKWYEVVRNVTFRNNISSLIFLSIFNIHLEDLSSLFYSFTYISQRNDMENIITASNPSSTIMVVVPCVLTAAGIVTKLQSNSKVNGLVKVINRIDEAYSGVLKTSDVIVVLNISESTSQLAEEIKFINWCRTVQPSAVIIAYTRNHKLSVLNYIAALGVRIIISQYESSATFSDFINKSFNSKVMLCTLIIKSILEERMMAELTVCEVQVIGQLFLGHNVSQVAHNLGRDIRTVSSHKRHAMEKLGLHCEKDLHLLGCALSGK